MTTELDTPLPTTRVALEQARRVLEQLPKLEEDATAYRDQLPYVLDRLQNIRRTIDCESKGRRTVEFSKWWATERDHPNRVALSRLRNAELKENQQSTRGRFIFRTDRLLRVDPDGNAYFIDEHGKAIEPDVRGIADAGARLHSVTWEFAVPGIDGWPVQETLGKLFRDLAERVVPTAERLLSMDAPRDKLSGASPPVPAEGASGAADPTHTGEDGGSAASSG